MATGEMPLGHYQLWFYNRNLKTLDYLSDYRDPENVISVRTRKKYFEITPRVLNQFCNQTDSADENNFDNFVLTLGLQTYSYEEFDPQAKSKER